jgi:putative transposase
MDRLRLDIEPGNIVSFNSEKFEVLRSFDASSVLARKLHSQEVQRLFIDELSHTTDDGGEVLPEKLTELTQLSEKEWEIAKKRFDLISEVFNVDNNINSVAQISKNAGVHKTTIYRWIKKYLRTGKVSSLTNDENDGGKGGRRLNKEVEAVIHSVINNLYLTTQQLSIKKVTLEIAIKCKSLGLQAPDYATVKKRITDISKEKRIAKRFNRSIANNLYEPVRNGFPGADYPLSVVQIDHTLLDIILVDDVNREPVGRPWITIAIDVFSRMVLGFYISLDPPGAMGTGLCLSHAILPKQLWLSKINVEGEWPCYGLMKSIHLDNAKEFHGYMLERACEEYGIEINFRPVANPKYGGHVERLIGTVLNELHAVKGTTFSDPSQRKFYKSEKKACFTINELEKWLTTFIVNVYHKRTHSTIKTSPLSKYTEGVLGSKNQVGTGLQKPILNELKLRLDFMPHIERTIQRYGVQINFIFYYHDILRKWIHAHESPETHDSTKRKFIFKIDPRDISVIYFYDPEIKDYFPIPYRNTGLPPMSIWEYREVLRSLHKTNDNEITENAIFEAYSKMKEIEESASATSIQTRRKNTRTRYALQKSTKNEFVLMESSDIKETNSKRENILPFEDLEDEPFK